MGDDWDRPTYAEQAACLARAWGVPRDIAVNAAMAHIHRELAAGRNVDMRDDESFRRFGARIIIGTVTHRGGDDRARHPPR